MFPSGSEEPASGSDGVSRSALFTSPELISETERYLAHGKWEYTGSITKLKNSQDSSGTLRGDARAPAYALRSALHPMFLEALVVVRRTDVAVHRGTERGRRKGWDGWA